MAYLFYDDKKKDIGKNKKDTFDPIDSSNNPLTTTASAKKKMTSNKADRSICLRVPRNQYAEYERIVRENGLRPTSVLGMFVNKVVKSDGEILKRLLD